MVLRFCAKHAKAFCVVCGLTTVGVPSAQAFGFFAEAEADAAKLAVVTSGTSGAALSEVRDALWITVEPQETVHLETIDDEQTVQHPNSFVRMVADTLDSRSPMQMKRYGKTYPKS
jgi:hypothetical protein